MAVNAQYLKKNYPKFPLVFAGQKGWLMEDSEEYIKQPGMQNQVLLLGYVTDDELLWLYQNCFLNLYSSNFECFGLPVLEAMQFGAPTLTNQDTSLSEITYSEGLLKTNDQKDWLDAMIAFQENAEFRQTLIKKGYAYVEKFTWEKSAAQTVNFYQKILKMPKLYQE